MIWLKKLGFINAILDKILLKLLLINFLQYQFRIKMFCNSYLIFTVNFLQIEQILQNQEGSCFCSSLSSWLSLTVNRRGGGGNWF